MTNSSSSSASSSSSSDDDSSTSSSSGGGSHGDKLNSTLNPQISSKIDDDEDAEEEQPLTIQINSKYAREYEIRKRREELTKHHHARNDDDDDDDDCASSGTSGSSSESEDEEGELLTPQLDVQILQTLRALKSGDARLYDKNVKFFDNTKAEEDDYGDDDDDDEEEELQKNKPMRYKDVVREQILEQMEDEDDKEENIDRDGGDDKQKFEEEHYNLAYDQEQREIRRAFLESTREDDSEDEICDNTNMKGIKKKKGSRQHDNVDEKDDEADNEEYWIKPKAKRTGLNDGDDDDDAMAKRLWEEELKLRSTKKKNKHDDTTTTITGHLRSSSSNDDDDEMNDKLLADPKGEIQDGDQFLLEFMTHRKWMEPDGTKSNKSGSKKNRNDADDDEVNDVDVDDDSLDDLDRMDDFESKYNFRFEEANDSNHTQEEHLQQHGIVHYARSSNATTKVLRRKEESRKLKRLARKERKAEERKAKEEKLKRLKNAKRDELRSRMDKLRNVLGYKKSSKGESAGVLADIDDDFDDSAGLLGSAEEEMILKLMEGDYDPDKFEQVMNTAYGEEYYNKEDVMWKSDKDVKLDLMAAAGGGDDETDVDIGIADNGIGAMYDDDDDNEDDNEEDYQDEGFEEDDGQPWNGEKEVPSEGVSQLDKKLQSKMMDELYKLDYEDIIGDMPTRFKYRSVEANNYGLSTEEILFARDSTLKQFVSLKKMAPYRDEEEYQPGAKRRKRFRQMAKAEKSSLVEGESTDAISGVSTKHQLARQGEQEEDGGDTKKKKRRRQKKSGNSKGIEGGVAATENVESTTDEIKQTLLSEGNDAGGGEGGESEKKRRRRKKKVRRNDDDDNNVAINDKSDADNHIQSSTIAELPRPSSSSVVESQQPKKAPKDKKRKKDKKANKNPSGGNDHGTTSIKKRKSSSKRHAIDGVSGARLAAYGI